MWRALVVVGVLLRSGGASANFNINCTLQLHNPDRCIFFIEMNRTLQTYYANYTNPLDIVEKVCGGTRTLNGTSVTSSHVKVHQPNETQIIAEKYPLSSDAEFFILASRSNGGSLGDTGDYRIYRFLNGHSHEYSTGDSMGHQNYLAWARVGRKTAALVACQVDLTRASTPKPNPMAEDHATRTVGTTETEPTTEPIDEFPEETYLSYFDQLPQKINGTIQKTSIDCETDAEFVGLNISVAITDANCKRDLKVLGIKTAKDHSIKRSFEADAQEVERCQSPKLEFIGVNRTALNFVFRCKSWGMETPWWPDLAMSLLGITIFAEIVIFIPFVWKDFHPTVPDNVEEVVTL